MHWVRCFSSVLAAGGVAISTAPVAAALATAIATTITTAITTTTLASAGGTYTALISAALAATAALAAAPTTATTPSTSPPPSLPLSPGKGRVERAGGPAGDVLQIQQMFVCPPVFLVFGVVLLASPLWSI